MYNQNYKVELPQFPDREVSIAEYGAKSGDLQIETGRHNAEAINRAICEVSEQGGGTVRVPAGIWAVAPLRLLSGVNPSGQSGYVKIHQVQRGLSAADHQL